MAFHRGRARIRTVSYLREDLRHALQLEADRSERTVSRLIERAVRLALARGELAGDGGPAAGK